MPQSLVDLALILDRHRHQAVVLDALEDVHQGAGTVIGIDNLPVTQEVDPGQELLDSLQAGLIVAGEVVAVGKMEGIDIVIRRWIAPVDDLQGQAVGRGAAGTAALTLGEELFLRYLAGLGMVGDKDQFHLLVPAAQETHHPEEEGACDILLICPHGAGGIHHGQDYGAGLVADLLLPGFKAQVLRRNTADGQLALHGVALEVFQEGTFFIQVAHEALAAHVAKLISGGSHHRFLFLPEVGKLQVPEEHLLDFFQGDLGLVVIHPRFVAGPGPPASAFDDLTANNGPLPSTAAALAGMLPLVVVKAEVILLQAADGHPDHLFTPAHDDTLFSYDVRQVFFDGFPDLFLVPLLIQVTLAVQGPVFPGKVVLHRHRTSPPL
ncbi:2-polyprenyl-6-methoxyphenol hydroxylase and related FAD-dependent oxidoreductases [Moorella thermoacetica Y72]|uniref:2-polyprenyl-6-methoxyphenol hydroxylase and related FAD-dependent oxidoreductases n=1 Tax=Moorella thermoacetica Y72 TaxID=1325331 RepID=A0A0S6UD76_NEOTH|nr:2-polyprenyl-6-methoxyphenol hydroxylase and related FAD-dependent oxidoreductases [Moorella thermoacetica Y72]